MLEAKAFYRAPPPAEPVVSLPNKKACGEVFFTAGLNTIPFFSRKGGRAMICSKKHFYLFRTKAKKVKVAVKESRKQVLHNKKLLIHTRFYATS